MRMVIYGVVGILFFVGAGAGSWYVKTTYLTPPVEEEPADALALAFNESSPTTDSITAGDDDMKVPIRTKPVTLDEILDFNTKLEEREAALKKRQEDMDSEAQRLKIILGDIESEAKTMESMQKSVADNLGVLESRLQQVKDTLLETGAERKRIADVEGDIRDDEIQSGIDAAQNLKKVADMVAGMDNAAAAKVLREYANDGKLDFAAQLLDQVEARTGAAIISALEDEKIQTQLYDRMMSIRKPPVTKKKR